MAHKMRETVERMPRLPLQCHGLKALGTCNLHEGTSNNQPTTQAQRPTTRSQCSPAKVVCFIPHRITGSCRFVRNRTGYQPVAPGAPALRTNMVRADSASKMRTRRSWVFTRLNLAITLLFIILSPCLYSVTVFSTTFYVLCLKFTDCELNNVDIRMWQASK